MRAPLLFVLGVLGVIAGMGGCGGNGDRPRDGSGSAPDGADAAMAPDGAASDDGGTGGANGSGGGDLAGTPCTTRVSYGDRWIHPASHPGTVDVADGAVTWDGVCTGDGANSYALLSNGWRPYFSGHGGCVLALDSTCAGAPAACATRVSYGAAWIHPAGHAAAWDDVAARVTWDRACTDAGAQSVATLSNGWAPHFDGNGACSLSLRYSQCGGLYANALLPACADPGVVRDGDRYVAVCTSGNAADAFPMHVSTDLVHWSASGHILPSAKKPAWATSDFWAPEIHKVGAGWVAYFTARGSDGKLAIGAATAPSATGPFTALPAPLVHDANMGLIDATEFTGSDGKPYLLWKEDGRMATPSASRRRFTARRSPPTACRSSARRRRSSPTINRGKAPSSRGRGSTRTAAPTTSSTAAPPTPTPATPSASRARARRSGRTPRQARPS